MVFAQTSSGGSYTAGTGLTLTGSAFSVNVAQTQITSVGTLTALSVSGTVTGASVVGGVITGTSVSVAGNVTAGNVSATGLAGTLSTAAQTSITSVGTLGSLSVTGNITGGNVLGGANVNATTHTGTTVSVTGNITSGASVNTTNLSVSGNVLGDLLPSANVTFNLGSPTQRWNTLYLAANTINLGIQTISATGTGISMGTGNLTGGNVITTGLALGGMVVTHKTKFE